MILKAERLLDKRPMTPESTLMNKLLQAIALASEGHRAQTRKVDGTPYIAHPLAVGMILQTVTADE
ncbi:MAG TPA: hypothetical protein PK018_01085, partial [Candidatus Competibacter sp.]|nr:hypothetical protein [Candidatus Competibacter sp.]